MQQIEAALKGVALLSPLAIGIAVVAVVAVVALTLLGRRDGGTFAKKPFMTRNEIEFLSRLERALPEFRVHSQVAMGAILRPAVGDENRRVDRRRYMSTRGRFAQKIIDYVLQDRENGSIVAIIELDDQTHDPAKDATRDAMLHDAGYNTIRFHSRRKPSVEEIRHAILELT